METEIIDYTEYGLELGGKGIFLRVSIVENFGFQVSVHGAF